MTALVWVRMGTPAKLIQMMRKALGTRSEQWSFPPMTQMTQFVAPYEKTMANYGIFLRTSPQIQRDATRA